MKEKMNKIIKTLFEGNVKFEVYSDGDVMVTNEFQYFVIDQKLISKLIIKNSFTEQKTPAQDADPIATIEPIVATEVRKTYKQLSGSGGWICEFTQDGELLCRHVYVSRRYARLAEPQFEVGTHGRIPSELDKIAPSGVEFKNKIKKDPGKKGWLCLFQKDGQNFASHVYASRSTARKAVVNNKVGSAGRIG